jgi:uncharacterized protein (DUF433 family)
MARKPRLGSVDALRNRLVAVVLDNLGAGLSADEIVAGYPSLRLHNVRAATAYAAELALLGRIGTRFC